MEKISCKFIIHFFLRGALTDLVPFAQFKKREKHPWRSVTYRRYINAMPNIKVAINLKSF